MTNFQAKKLTVAVIFAPHAQRQIETLAAVMPVWAIESPENARAIADARLKYQYPLTVFFARPSESKVDMCSRILFDIDDHHPFNELNLYDASLADIDSEALDILKIDDKQSTEYGCCLRRKMEHSDI